jgi:preprotein translocase subunit SecY
LLNKEIFKRIFLLAVAVFIFRLGSYISVPNLNSEVLGYMIGGLQGTVFDVANTFSGGALSRFSIFSVGIMPYITASIIIQILSLSVPALANLKNEGPKGVRKIKQYIFSATIGIATVQSYLLLSNVSGYDYAGQSLVVGSTIHFIITGMFVLLAGTVGLIFVAAMLTKKGVGNGISLMIFASIVASLPQIYVAISEKLSIGEMDIPSVFFFIMIIMFFVYLIFFVEKSQRRIPTIKSISNSLELSNKQFIPFKLNMGGIMPAIFTSILITLPYTIARSFTGTDLEVSFLDNIAIYLEKGQPAYYALSVAILVSFYFFYVKAVYSYKKISDGLRSSGSVVQGMRPGDSTENYIKEMIEKLAFIGSIYLLGIVFLPELIIGAMGINFVFGGTSILIMCIVAGDWREHLSSFVTHKDYEDIKNKIGKI